ncbi:hypothetical protein GF343_01255 [Candidatus Woesearchaeota archaeon]|nr:hypothetical protein [Candidatus Woesearchaeota archaeon]
MAKIEYVKEIDDLINIQTAFVTATDKSGLVDNLNKKDGSVLAGVPANGIIGVLFEVNPDALVISTGGTAGLIEKAGFKVMPVGDFTGWPEMETGLVKSMQAKLYVGMLAHKYTESDLEYMQKHGIPSIDLTLANFYPFEEAVAKNPLGDNPFAFEIIRQNMDVGGPTAVHTSRKGFLGTAVTTRPEDYAMFIKDLRKYGGQISLDSRVVAIKHCTKDLARYYAAIDEFMGGVDTETVRKVYPVIHNPAEE